MSVPLETALAGIREHLLGDGLVRAVAAGRRRGHTPSVVRAELRPVTLRQGRRLQLVTSDGQRPATRNVGYGAAAEQAVDALLAEPFGNWRVESTATTVQLRVTRSGAAQVHYGPGVAGGGGRHDRAPAHLLDPGDPLFDVIGGDAAKRRQVDAFLRALSATLPGPSTDLPQPLRVADLGCGNAYLTFAAYRWLTADRGLDVRLVGVDVRDDQRARNTELAERLGWDAHVTFTASTIMDAPLEADLVLALHACDTATDEALARAVDCRAQWILAAPCCHHDLAAQLREASPPAPYQALTRHGILRERYADVLTDALRAALLRLAGYRVEVVEFIESTHTPRNLLLRAAYTGAPATGAQRREYDELVDAWSVTPRLATLLAATGDAVSPQVSR